MVLPIRLDSNAASGDITGLGIWGRFRYRTALLARNSVGVDLGCEQGKDGNQKEGEESSLHCKRRETVEIFEGARNL